uniref:Uncharacterized protein n=1 Tax=Arundo donax TaxID=35708 RepID=A0A0A9UMF8_ARUDO
MENNSNLKFSCVTDCRQCCVSVVQFWLCHSIKGFRGLGAWVVLQMCSQF